MERNTLIIIIVLFIITNCFNFGLFCNNKKNIKNVEKMANTGDITEQINKIYKADITSIRNLAEISKKLQEGKLSIPGNLTVEGKLFAEGDSDMRLLKASRIILSGRDITNELNQLNAKISSLESRLTNSDSKHTNGLSTLTNNFNQKWTSRFPNAETIVLGDARLIDWNSGVRFVHKGSGQTKTVWGHGFTTYRGVL